MLSNLCTNDKTRIQTQVWLIVTKAMAPNHFYNQYEIKEASKCSNQTCDLVDLQRDQGGTKQA